MHLAVSFHTFLVLITSSLQVYLETFLEYYVNLIGTALLFYRGFGKLTGSFVYFCVMIEGGRSPMFAWSI